MDLDEILSTISNISATRRPLPDARTAREEGAIPPTQLGPPGGSRKRPHSSAESSGERTVRFRNDRGGDHRERAPQRSSSSERRGGGHQQQRRRPLDEDIEVELPSQHRSRSGSSGSGRGRGRGGRGGRGQHRGRRRRDEDDDDDEDEVEEEAAEDDDDGGRRDRSTVESTRAHPPPSQAYVEAYLGPANPDRSQCWFCHSGRTNSAAIPFKAWNQLMTMYRRSRVDTDPIVLAMEMHVFFEKYIRTPANKYRSRGQEAIPEQTAIDIYIHCKKHIKEASNRLIQRLEELQELGDTIYEQNLYKPIRNIRGEVRLVVRKKELDAYLKVIKEERMMRKERPERMVLFSNDYCLDTSDVRGFANVQRPFYMDNMPSYLLGGGDPNTRRAIKNAT